MKVREIAAAIEAFAPLGTQESWDNAGLCIGSPDAEVRAVLVGFDCTPALVREAVDRGADMIVTHHPLIFHGLKRVTDEDFTGRRILKLIENRISLIASFFIFILRLKADSVSEDACRVLSPLPDMSEVLPSPSSGKRCHIP